MTEDARTARRPDPSTAPSPDAPDATIEASGLAEAVRLIAFYLPQYHPIPENDAWWGPGFTEWTNVARGRPQFPGHEQPHLPADLGFYDLRLPEAREAQASLARRYGIHGFCYYHYWFTGRRLLDRPFREVLESARPDLPFCLCWANEPWSRRWDGSDREVLMPQTYSAEDDREHLRWLADAFADPRYIRVDGRPLFLVYRTSQLPEPARTADRWRDEARRLGLAEPFLCRVEGFAEERDGTTPSDWGFDAAVEFVPDWQHLGVRQGYYGRRNSWGRRLGLVSRGFERHRVFPYEVTVERSMSKPAPPYERFRCVTPMFDNTARRPNGGGIVLTGSSPERYGGWLSRFVRDADRGAADRRIVFINAWNEWAEGNHLEPCQRWGHAYLEATRSALGGA